MTKITKAEFDALPDSLKTKFEADGDGYVLAEPDVEGLKKSKAEILEEKKRIQAERDELAKFKAEREAESSKAEEEMLAKKGEFDTILAQKEKAWQERIDAETVKNNKTLATLHREQLKTELIKRGVMADRVDYLAGELVDRTEFAMGDDGFSLKKKGGVGDAAEFDTMVSEAKAAKPFFFESTTASGSGASPSTGPAGVDLNSMTPTQLLDVANAQSMGQRT